MSNTRVLVIDEDVETRRKLREILQSAGYQVDDAPDGLEALELVRKAQAYNEGYNCIVSELFLPDTDGRLFFQVLRMQYPKVPFVIVTGFGDEERREWCQRLAPVAYHDKPYSADGLLASIGELVSTASTAIPVAAEASKTAEFPFSEYLYLQIAPTALADQLYTDIESMDGVVGINAVRGEGIQLVVRLGVDSQDKVTELVSEVAKLDGIKVVGHDKLVEPVLTPQMAGFVDHYQQLAKVINAEYVSGVETNAYLMIDIDRYRLEQIYLSTLLTEGVVRCRVVSGFQKIVVLMAGAVKPNVVRHLLGKLAQMDGIRRVREVTVVNMQG